MINLLRFELRKLLRNKTCYVCFGVQIIYLLLNILINKATTDTSEEFAEFLGIVALTGTQYLLMALSQSSTILVLAVLISVLSCEDRTHDVLKNIYARGYTSTEVYFAEMIILCATGTAFCLINWFTGFVFGAMFYGVGSKFFGKQVAMLFVQIMVVYGEIAMFLMFSKLINKLSGVICMNIFAPIILDLVFLILGSLSLKISDVNLSQYSLTGLMKTVSDRGSEGIDVGIAAILSVVYTAAFAALGWLCNRRRAA